MKNKIFSIILLLSLTNSFFTNIYAENSFATREYVISEFANYIDLSNDINAENILSEFTDSNNISLEYRYNFAKAISNKLVTGYNDNTLHPTDNILRVEALAILSRCLGNLNTTSSTIEFDDVPEWAKQDIDKLSSAGIVKGYGNNKLGAFDYITINDVSLLIERVKNKPLNNVSYFLAPNTTSEMCNADYWANKTAQPDNIIMNPSEIEALNKQTLDTEKTNMNDLKNLPDTFDGKLLSESLSTFPSPANLYLNGKAVEESYYESIRQNIKNADVTDNMTLKYGIAVNRAVMKAYPYSDYLSDDPNDPEWDELSSTAIYVNEPLALYFSTSDGKYIYVKSECCSGWIEAFDVAICKNKSEWIKATNFKNLLIVTGEKIYLEPSADFDVSEKSLSMGTKLEYVDSFPGKVTYRMPWDNYVVLLPARDENGNFYQKKVMIPANRDVNIGYLPYTVRNVLSQAFKELGNRYGWGGMLNSQDCSAYAREIYRCFGINLPRNTTWQSAMPVNVTYIGEMNDTEKKAYLDTILPGTIIQFPGHEMVYLGSENGLYYTINNVSSLVDPTNIENGVIRPRGVIVNDLSTQRRNGTTWLSNLDCSIEIK